MENEIAQLVVQAGRILFLASMVVLICWIVRSGRD